MKKLSFLIVTLALVWAPMAFAAGTSGPRLCKLTTLLDAIVLTDTLANRTATIGPEDTCGTGVIGRSSRKVTVGSFQYANFDINYTRATAGDLTLTFTTGITAATATAALGVCSTVVNGNCQLEEGGLVTITVTTSSIHVDLRLDIRSRRVIKVVVAHSAAAAGDIITLNGYLTD